MSNRPADILFQLIHSLEKSEKRHFKLYIKRSSAREELKIVQLFDILDRMTEYDEKAILKKMPSVTKPQLANLKTHLYKQILAALRLLKTSDSLDLQLNEQFDYAHILYKKGLFYQSLRILERARDIARNNHKLFFLPQIIALEKRIESLNITHSMGDKAEVLANESKEINQHVSMVSGLSDLAIRMYSWFIKNGHSRNKEDEKVITKFFKENLPDGALQQTGFYERLYLYQSYTWFAFIRQDFLMYYRYAQKWVDLFEENHLMKRVETGNYIKGLHNRMNAHFDLRNYEKFDIDLKNFEAFAKTPRVKEHDNFRVQCFIYITTAKINQHFMLGTFKEGLKLVPQIEERLKEDHLFIDEHRILVIRYKIAMLYFGSEKYDECIDYLQMIINGSSEMRTDLQCYARLLHLMAHYELGNLELMDSLTRSVYRFMSKMKNLTFVEQEIFRFVKNSFTLSAKDMKNELQKLLEKLKTVEKDRYQTRSFAYLDIISWLESKVQRSSMSNIIHNKYQHRKQRNYTRQHKTSER